MATVKKKNLLQSKDVYNAYYGDFRGVDFSSDHTQVNRQRLAYAVNMYKDYRSGQGQCIETIAGFRRRFAVPDGAPIYGIHPFQYTASDGTEHSKVIIHAGKKLYEWENDSHDVGVECEEMLTLTDTNTELIGESDGIKSIYVSISSHISEVTSVTSVAGEALTKSLFEDDRTNATFFYNSETHKLRVSYDSLDEPYNRLQIEYKTDPAAAELTVEEVIGEDVSPVKLSKTVEVDSSQDSWLIPMDVTVGEIIDVVAVNNTWPLIWEYDAVGRCLSVTKKNPDAPVTKIQYTYYPAKKGELVLTSEYLTEQVTSNGGVISRLELKLPKCVYGIPLFFNSSEKVFANGAYTYNEETRVFSCPSGYVNATLILYYIVNRATEGYTFPGMNECASTSFIFNNRLYILDGRSYLVYDGETLENVSNNAYIPTAYINAVPGGENADAGTEYEQRNLMQPLFKQTFVGDGATTVFSLNYKLLDAITEVKKDGVVTTATTDPVGGTVIFITAPGAGALVEVTMRKTIDTVSGITGKSVVSDAATIIAGCTIASVFDNRIFLSGNPKYPNHVFWSGINKTGYSDPTYFGELNYVQDGVGMSPITGMIPLADTLMVLKNDTQQDGSVYYHTPTKTGEDLIPKIYPSVKGLNGTGCLGACMNFLDDPVFVSRMGLEAIGQLSVRYERAMEHRSSLIDAKLMNIDLSHAVLEVWNGYLCLLCDGKIFMADSKQRYAHETGVMQYEWFYLEDIAIYDGQYTEYIFSSQLGTLEGKQIYIAECPICDDGMKADIPIELKTADDIYDALLHEHHDLRGSSVNAPSADCGMNLYENVLMYCLNEETAEKIYFRGAIAIPKGTVSACLDNEHASGYTAYLCETRGNKVGGTRRKATTLKTIDNNLYFGTENGFICSFNFDKRTEEGEIPTKWYSFDGRTIYSGCATRMDSCDIPHLTKTTVKKSTVIKTKAMERSAAKVKVRTNRKPYNQIARINSARFQFDDLDFSDFSFETMDKSLYSIKEKEKKWVEKQYYIYSDEYRKPFSLYYISYRYTIAGRYKE